MARSPLLHRGADDRGGIVIGWLTRIAVVAAVLGLAGFDVVSIGVGRLSVEDQATDAARAAADVWRTDKAVQPAYDAALASAIQANPLNTVRTTDFRVDADGTVHVTVEREATTFVVHHVHRLAHLADVHGTGTSRGSA